jgi:aspartyl protease family protein
MHNIHQNTFLFLFVLSILSSCSDNSLDTSYLEVDDDEYYESDYDFDTQSYYSVAFTESYGDIIIVPVKINGVTFDMIYDTGASNTTISLTEAIYLYDKGYLTDEDIVGIESYQTADGSIHEGVKIILRSVDIGTDIKLKNISASVVLSQDAPLLLGQSVFREFTEISVDHENQVLKFYP